MDLHVFSQRAGMSVGLVTHFAEVRLVRSVHVHVLFAIAAVSKTPVAPFELTFEWLLPCVSSFVDLEIF